MRLLFHQMPAEILEGVYKFLKEEVFKRGYIADLNGNSKSFGVMTMLIALSNGHSFGKFDVAVPIGKFAVAVPPPTQSVSGAANQPYLPRI